MEPEAALRAFLQRFPEMRGHEIMASPTPISTLLSQLWQLFLADEQTAVLPDVAALFTYIAQNGISMAGFPQLLKALTAVEADGLAGGQQFLKDAAPVVLAWIQATIAVKTPFVKKAA